MKGFLEVVVLFCLFPTVWTCIEYTGCRECIRASCIYYETEEGFVCDTKKAGRVGVLLRIHTSSMCRLLNVAPAAPSSTPTSGFQSVLADEVVVALDNWNISSQSVGTEQSSSALHPLHGSKTVEEEQTTPSSLHPSHVKGGDKNVAPLDLKPLGLEEEDVVVHLMYAESTTELPGSSSTLKEETLMVTVQSGYSTTEGPVSEKDLGLKEEVPLHDGNSTTTSPVMSTTTTTTKPMDDLPDLTTTTTTELSPPTLEEPVDDDAGMQEAWLAAPTQPTTTTTTMQDELCPTEFSDFNDSKRNFFCQICKENLQFNDLKKLWQGKQHVPKHVLRLRIKKCMKMFM